MTGVKTAWYKTRWGVAAMAGVVGISLGSGMAGNNKEHAAAPVSYTTVSVTPSPVVETVMATVTETAMATVAVTETAQPASVPATEEQVKPTSSAGNANRQESVYYSSCKEAKKAGAAPLRVGDPGYRSGLDRDGDGIACEK
jgi:excalibur domain protein